MQYSLWLGSHFPPGVGLLSQFFSRVLKGSRFGELELLDKVLVDKLTTEGREVVESVLWMSGVCVWVVTQLVGYDKYDGGRGGL